MLSEDIYGRMRMAARNTISEPQLVFAARGKKNIKCGQAANRNTLWHLETRLHIMQLEVSNLIVIQ